MSTPTPEATLPPGLRLGPVHLRVANLDRALAWYTTALGLQVLRRDGPDAALGTADGEDVVVLHEDPEARPAGRHSGLYHYALLYPSREELARAVLRLGVTRTPVDGASDHETHEAIYLPDADGNGIELAADRPREAWPASLGYAGGPQPLDLDDLLSTVAGEEPATEAGPGLRVGHVHLHVGDLERGLRFYRDLLGFDVMALLPSAAFVAAGGYHHHLGFNTWQGAGAPPVPDGVVGLDHWTLVLPGPADVAGLRARVERAGVPVEDRDGRAFLVRDPWSIPLLVTTAGEDA
jgi:catechol 2,3-dioxygenase